MLKNYAKADIRYLLSHTRVGGYEMKAKEDNVIVFNRRREKDFDSITMWDFLKRPDTNSKKNMYSRKRRLKRFIKRFIIMLLLEIIVMYCFIYLPQI